MKNSQIFQFARWPAAFGNSPALPLATVAVLSFSLALIAPDTAAAKKNGAATHSTTIALTSDEERVVVVNREANSVSIIRVKKGKEGCQRQAR